MLEENIIEEAESEWASPVVLIPKKNGEVRFCVDYRKLNSVRRTYKVLDDFLVISPDLESHLKDLQQVFERLRLFNLKANK